MSTLTGIIVAALVTAFAAQVVSEDDVTKPARDWLKGLEASKAGKRRPLAVFFNGLIGCPRCSGVWLSIPATQLALGQWAWTDWRLFLVTFMAASYLQWWIMTIVLNLGQMAADYHKKAEEDEQKDE